LKKKLFINFIVEIQEINKYEVWFQVKKFLFQESMMFGSYRLLGGKFWEVEKIALVLGLIIKKFPKTCIHTLREMIFWSHFLIMGPMEENLFSKINSRQTSIFISFKLCHLKYHQNLLILGKFHLSSRTLTLWKIVFHFLNAFEYYRIWKIL
jgi:hypothetical protein